MKKKLLLILAIGMIAITACGKQENPIEEETITAEETTIEDGDAESEISAESNSSEEADNSEESQESEEIEADQESANAEGIKEPIILNKGLCDDYYPYDAYQIGDDMVNCTIDRKLIINEDSYDIATDSEFCNSFTYVYDDGTYWLFLCTFFGNDFGSVIPVYVDGQHKAKVFDEIECIVNKTEVTANTLKIVDLAQIVGSHEYIQTYNITSGTLTNTEEFRKFNYNEERSEDDQITLKTSFTVYSLDNNAATTFDQGTAFYPIGYNPTTKQFVVETNNAQYYFNYDSTDSMTTIINGQDAGTIFDGLRFFG